MNRLALCLIPLLIITAKAGDAKLPPIITDQHDAEIFPVQWRGGKVNAEADLLAVEAREPAAAIVKQALSLYPLAVLEKNLSRVHLVGGLRYSGVSAGGTRSSMVVYLVAGNSRYTPGRIRRIFHAEFSSILFLNYKDSFDAKAWRATLPDGFDYSGSGVQAIKGGQASQETTQELLAAGFLKQYSQASAEEDFNGYAAALLTGDETLWQAMENHPRVKTKAELAMKFYHRIDSTFTREFFLSLR